MSARANAIIATLEAEVRRLRHDLQVERRTSDALLANLTEAEEKLERIAELAR